MPHFQCPVPSSNAFNSSAPMYSNLIEQQGKGDALMACVRGSRRAKIHSSTATTNDIRSISTEGESPFSPWLPRWGRGLRLRPPGLGEPEKNKTKRAKGVQKRGAKLPHGARKGVSQGRVIWSFTRCACGRLVVQGHMARPQAPASALAGPAPFRSPPASPRWWRRTLPRAPPDPPSMTIHTGQQTRAHNAVKDGRRDGRKCRVCLSGCKHSLG